MKTSCEVIKDLLPLYYDKVCSAESGALVEEHIIGCSSCREILAVISDELSSSVSTLDDVKPIKAIQKVWKKDKIKSLIKGILITVLVFAVLAICAYILYFPRPVIKSPYSMAYDIERTYSEDGSYGVSYRTVDDDFFLISRILYKGEDVTERFDPEGVALLLNNTMSRRTTRRTGSADMLWEIDITRKNGPVHICLGQTDPYSGKTLNYWYQSGTHYQIIDPTNLIIILERSIMSAER